MDTMTAPAIAPAPAQAPVVTPVAPTDPVAAAVLDLTPVVGAPIAETDSKEDRIARIGRKVTEHGQSFADQTPATEQAPAVDAIPVIDGTTLEPIGATPPTMVNVVEVDDGDGKVVLRARDPKTGLWSEMDQSRTYELSIKGENGEERVYQKDLPGVLRLAKDGLAMQKVKDELHHYRTETPRWSKQFDEMQGTISTAQQRAERLEGLAMQLLTADEAEVVRMREEYAKQFTPESEIQRLRAELDRVKNRGASPQAPRPPAVDPQIQQATQGFAQRTAPVVQEVERLVGREVAVGQMALFTLPLLVNGRIPPHKLADVEAYIVGPYRQWAQQMAASKTSSAHEHQKQLDAARAIQQKAQLSANTVGAATRPLGGLPSNAPVQQPPPKNREDLINRIARGRPQTQMAG